MIKDKIQMYGDKFKAFREKGKPLGIYNERYEVKTPKKHLTSNKYGLKFLNKR